MEAFPRFLSATLHLFYRESGREVRPRPPRMDLTSTWRKAYSAARGFIDRMTEEMDETTNPAPDAHLTVPEVTAPATVTPEAVASVVAQALAAPNRRKQSAVDLISMWLGNLVVSLLTAAFVVIFLYQPVKVEGTSMLPGLEDQERISRGDVIVFRYPSDASKSYSTRVIGVAGDRIHIVDGLVYVNDELLSEDYVPQQYADWRSVPEFTVPQGSYFMLGDHRNMSSDSRDFGPVDQKFVVGKAVFGYWPFEKLGKVK